MAVRPPRDEEFKDLKPLGSNYRSDNFKGKVASIAREEDRGIDIDQLLLLYSHISRRCSAEGWRSVDNATVELMPSTCTMYDVCSYVLQPSTYFHRCSFVELLSAGGLSGPSPSHPIIL